MGKELYDAAALIRKSCEEREFCLGCPFYLGHDECYFDQWQIPETWDLNIIENNMESSDALENVNHPKHYTQGKVECIDALAAATINLQGIEAVCTANAIKYLWRWKQKNGVEDLKKANWYIDKLMQEEGGCNHE